MKPGNRFEKRPREAKVPNDMVLIPTTAGMRCRLADEKRKRLRIEEPFLIPSRGLFILSTYVEERHFGISLIDRTQGLSFKKARKESFGLIELKQVTKRYGKGTKTTEALSGLNLSIKKGEIFGVIGHSGA